MSNFKDFQRDILSLPYIREKKEDVYFSQLCDGYSAKYSPHYPKGSTSDFIIQTTDRSGAYLRGNYELMIYDNSANKYISVYFQDIDQLKEYLENR